MESARMRLWTCARCLRVHQPRLRRPAKQAISSSPLRADKIPSQKDETATSEATQRGAMSRRLSEMVEESIDKGSRSDRRTLQSASDNFSEELKARLEARIAESAFASDNKKAITEANMPSYAGKGTAQSATAPAWTGNEHMEDAALRMLDDAHKKLRPTPRAPRIPLNVNLRPQPKSKVSHGARLANARDKTSIYASSQQDNMSDEEKEKFRKELKERFSPAARPMPQTLQGLTSLANERIEDAIARGQFKNIKRGKNVNTERDYNANSPFLDTTEYFMNKIIQKQEIVPPWIEKQQEVAKLIDTFRKRLRSDWRRHAARMIASEGGTLEQQMIRARGYALAEELVNPRVTDKQRTTGIGSDGSLVSITVEDRISAGIMADKPQPEVTVKVSKADSDTSATELRKMEQELEQEMQAVASLTASSSIPPPEPAPTTDTTMTPLSETTSPTLSPEPTTTAAAAATPSPPQRILPMPTPFRDPTWQRSEHAYHTLAIEEINNGTRSYNLMAPKIAQKPYTHLEHELKRCFAAVAPSVADEIAERARRPSARGFGAKAEQRTRGVLERVVGESGRDWRGHEGVIREEGEGKGYGFKEFWKDLFGKEKKGRREAA